ncbi:MAG: helix-turn-helix domain-containing protein [Bacteroidales bacterium]|nr:helix-turn-helix domain-containing protein [Bacteroidales bacterium]
MENIYALSDIMILAKLGEKIKNTRLKQNITQESLAETANISLSSVKKIENGEIKSFDSLLRVLRVLGKLDIFQPLIDEEQLSPIEYYELVNSTKKKIRKRAVGKLNNSKKEETEW